MSQRDATDKPQEPRSFRPIGNSPSDGHFTLVDLLCIVANYSIYGWFCKVFSPLQTRQNVLDVGGGHVDVGGGLHPLEKGVGIHLAQQKSPFAEQQVYTAVI